MLVGTSLKKWIPITCCFINTIEIHSSEKEVDIELSSLIFTLGVFAAASQASIIWVLQLHPFHDHWISFFSRLSQILTRRDLSFFQKCGSWSMFWQRMMELTGPSKCTPSCFHVEWTYFVIWYHKTRAIHSVLENLQRLDRRKWELKIFDRAFLSSYLDELGIPGNSNLVAHGLLGGSTCTCKHNLFEKQESTTQQ